MALSNEFGDQQEKHETRRSALAIDSRKKVRRLWLLRTTRVFAAVIVMLMIYVFSVGPVFRVCEGFKNPPNFIYRFYAPLQNIPGPFSKMLDRYTTWWLEDALQDSVVFEGKVVEGRTFIHGFGDRFVFTLSPIDHGWVIGILDERGVEDLSRFTPPLHGINDCYLQGWNFRNSDNTGPNDCGPKNVNAPQEIRSFIFSPEVGRTIAGPEAKGRVSSDDIHRIGRFGRGRLTILEYRLNNLVPGESAGFAWMKFRVKLWWND